MTKHNLQLSCLIIKTISALASSQVDNYSPPNPESDTEGLFPT